MKNKDPLVNALIALCEAEGGYKTVADETRVSPDNLWQIITGVKLPSGNARGVGPKLRAKITAVYPNWQQTPVASAAKPTAPPSIPADLLLLVRWIDGIKDQDLRNRVIQDCTQVYLSAGRSKQSPPTLDTSDAVNPQTRAVAPPLKQDH